MEMITLTVPRAAVVELLKLGELASERLSCAGCNDYDMPDIPDNREFLHSLFVASGDTEGSFSIYEEEGMLGVEDWFVLDGCLRIIGDALKTTP